MPEVSLSKVRGLGTCDLHYIGIVTYITVSYNLDNFKILTCIDKFSIQIKQTNNVQKCAIKLRLL